MPINSYKELLVWQKAIELSKEVYILTDQFPKEEIFGITSQMRRSSISIPSNIAEGRHRKTKKDFIQFLHIALGSGAELETQIEIAKILPKTKNLDFSKVSSLLSDTMKMLHGMINALNKAESR
jgi:four helix bundle protein